MLKLDEIDPIKFTVFKEELFADRDPEYNLAYLRNMESELNYTANDCGAVFSDGEIPTNLVSEVVRTGNVALWRAFCEVYAWSKKYGKNTSALTIFIKETNIFDPVAWDFVANLR